MTSQLTCTETGADLSTKNWVYVATYPNSMADFPIDPEVIKTIPEEARGPAMLDHVDGINIHFGIVDLEARGVPSVFVASADEGLDERGYIVPGLGDAGDLAFGQKL